MLMIIATNATFLWESWSNIAQVLSANVMHYVERAAYATDAEVKKCIKNDGSHKMSAIVVAPRRAQEENLSLVVLRARRGFVKRNESEQGLVMNEMQPMQALEGAENDPLDSTLASSTSSRISLA
jgi:hypothetical protein